MPPHIPRVPETRNGVDALSYDTVIPAQSAQHERTVTTPAIADDQTEDNVVEAAGGEKNAVVQTLKARGGFIKHYEIIRSLDEGGMGVVFLARDTKLGRLVAIKFVKDPSRHASRLLDEAQATAGIKHPNIITIYDIDEFDDHLYLVLEYVEGRTLRQILSENAKNNCQMAEGLALNIVTQVVRGLVAAHERGIVHRDLKPENVMLLDSGQIKVLDFGIATRMDQSLFERTGTRLYMSPEQWRGENVDGRADIWSVGLLLFELLLGKHPLEPLSESLFEGIASLDEQMPTLTTWRPNLVTIGAIVNRCLQKRPDNRYSSSSELLAALLALTPQAEFDTRLELAPFAGLSAFQEIDARRFFGRDRDIEAVVGRLERQCLMTIAGPSGGGKSSFVRAGIVPSLRASDVWEVFVIRPGRTPLAALIESLELTESSSVLQSHPGLLGTRLRERCRAGPQQRRALLFVDQFEEVFTLVDDAAEREAFLNSLLGAADEVSSPIRVVIAVRSDFLDRIAEEHEFMRRVLEGLYFLPPMRRENLQEALVMPVKAAGYQFESDDMVEDMLQSLATTKIPLPLLQFTAARLWNLRDINRKLLTRQSYEALGGVAGALSTHADALVAALSLHQQRLCRAICLRLVTPQRTRAIVSAKELAELSNRDPEVMTVVQYLSNERLLSMDTGTEESSAMVELVHESLIDKWPKLARWIEENADDAEFIARLRSATAQWLCSGKGAGLLWRDQVAEEARAWYARRKHTFGDTLDEAIGKNELLYLEAVVNLLGKTARRRRWAIITAFAVMSVALSAVGYFAIQSRIHAARADLEANSVREKNAELEKQALRGRNAMRVMAARKRLDDPTLALALLREVESADIPRDWPELASRTLSSGVAKIERTLLMDKPPYCVSYRPDGKKIAVGLGDGTVHIVDASSLAPEIVLRVHDKEVLAVVWTHDGTRVITSSLDHTARITRIDGSGEPIVLRGHRAQVYTVALSPNGERIATASEDNTVRLWKTKDGESLGIFRHAGAAFSAAFDATGERIVTGASDDRLRLWDTNAPNELPQEFGAKEASMDGTFSPDGSRIAAFGVDQTLRIWNVENLDEALVLRGHTGRLMSLAWSRDGKRVATSSKDKTVRIWTLDGSEEPIVLRGHQSWVYGVAFSPDNRYVLTTSLDRSIRLWNVADILRPFVLNGTSGTITYAAMSPNGQDVVATTTENKLIVWDLARPDKPTVLLGHSALAEHIAWNADSHNFVTSSQDGTARIWRLEPLGDYAVLRCGGVAAKMSAWSHDGQLVATLCADGVIRVWNADGKLLGTTPRNTGEPFSHGAIAFDPSGKHILVFDTRHDSVDIVDIDHDFRLQSIGTNDAWVTDAVWSPDGRHIAAGTRTQSLFIYDLIGSDPPIRYRESGPVRHLHWSPRGDRLAIQFEEGGFTVRDPRTSSNPTFTTPPGHRVERMVWHPDGSRIISTSDDTMARVWKADGTGQPFVLVHPTATISDVFTPNDGKRIALRADEHLIFVWPDVLPLTGPDDPRLWNATTYCIPKAIRVELLGVDEMQASKDELDCVQKTERISSSRQP